jgi:hypothetical protein
VKAYPLSFTVVVIDNGANDICRGSKTAQEQTTFT